MQPRSSSLIAEPPLLSPSESRRPRHRRQDDGGSGPVGTAWRFADRFWWQMIAVVTGITSVLYLTNLPDNPDFDIDETFYATAGQHIGLHGSVSWDTHPVLVHPPLYFLTVGAWLSVTGHLHSSILSAIHAARYLDGVYDILIVALVGVCARSWSERQSPAARGRLVVVSMLLTALNGFLLRFGRAVLIEPMAVCVGLVTLLVAWHLRNSRSPVYIGVVGLFIGFSVLTKEPLIFIAGAPFVTALLSRSRTAVLRNAGALAVGGLVWSSFPIWAAINGTWSSFYFQQTVSIRRLLGLLQLSGLNRKGVSASTAFTDTLLQYVGGYLVFGLGSVALVAGLWQVLRRGPLMDDEGAVAVLGLGLISYVFLLYSVFIGQSNEQLSVYVVPASVLLAVGYRRFCQWSWSGVLWPLASATCAAALVLGLTGWYLYFFTIRDNATQAVERYISTALPACVAVNSTGDPFHWGATLRTNPITGFGSGPVALSKGVHVFLLSTKDTKFQYGASSPELTSWVMAHGREVFLRKSHTYENISVWVVGQAVAPSGQSLPSCVEPLPGVATDARVDPFLGLLAADVALVGLALAVDGARQRRRSRARA